jgi:hypothetical protein
MCECVAVMDSLARGPAVAIPSYVRRVPDTRCAGRVVGRPVRTDIPFIVDESAIVEYYAR